MPSLRPLWRGQPGQFIMSHLDLWEEDSLYTVNKMTGLNVSFIQRFHCNHMMITWPRLHPYVHGNISVKALSVTIPQELIERWHKLGKWLHKATVNQCEQRNQKHNNQWHNWRAQRAPHLSCKLRFEIYIYYMYVCNVYFFGRNAHARLPRSSNVMGALYRINNKFLVRQERFMVSSLAVGSIKER